MIKVISSSDELNCVDVKLIDHFTCNSSVGYDGIVYDGQFCAGMWHEGGKDACQGDSGTILSLFYSPNQKVDLIISDMHYILSIKVVL